ncbi:unnamed protein product [Amoebophrya sp. A120]|nr:unnamed protein product [Amoebophrya sp. A120]|eukprot:GSA120T00014328001.1
MYLYYHFFPSIMLKQYLLRTQLAVLRRCVCFLLLGGCISRFWFFQINYGEPNQQPQISLQMVNAVKLTSSSRSADPQPVVPERPQQLQHPTFEEDPDQVLRSWNVWNREIVPAVAYLRNHQDQHLPATSSRSARREDDNGPAVPRLLFSYAACPLAPHPRDVPFPEKLLSCYPYNSPSAHELRLTRLGLLFPQQPQQEPYEWSASGDKSSSSTTWSTDGDRQAHWFSGTGHDLLDVVPSSTSRRTVRNYTGITDRGGPAVLSDEKNAVLDLVAGSGSTDPVDRRGTRTTGGADVEQPTVAAADDNHPKPPPHPAKAKPEPRRPLPLSAAEKAKTREALLSTRAEMDARVRSPLMLKSAHKVSAVDALMLELPATVAAGRWKEPSKASISRSKLDRRRAKKLTEQSSAWSV